VIVGVGIDIVQSGRIKEAIGKWENRFLNRIFTSLEQEYCLGHKNPHLFFGGRFAVKEAMFKALGTGWRGGVQWKEIQVENLKSGQPVVQVFGKIKEILQQKNVAQIHVSISHDTDYALGEVILESR
jgi:holo-[acyl-carrier protein] synthase